jgi:hypothetical protein
MSSVPGLLCLPAILVTTHGTRTVSAGGRAVPDPVVLWPSPGQNSGCRRGDRRPREMVNPGGRGFPRRPGRDGTRTGVPAPRSGCPLRRRGRTARPGRRPVGGCRRAGFVPALAPTQWPGLRRAARPRTAGTPALDLYGLSHVVPVKSSPAVGGWCPNLAAGGPGSKGVLGKPSPGATTPGTRPGGVQPSSRRAGHGGFGHHLRADRRVLVRFCGQLPGVSGPTGWFSLGASQPPN